MRMLIFKLSGSSRALLEIIVHRFIQIKKIDENTIRIDLPREKLIECNRLVRKECLV